MRHVLRLARHGGSYPIGRGLVTSFCLIMLLLVSTPRSPESPDATASTTPRSALQDTACRDSLGRNDD